MTKRVIALSVAIGFVLLGCGISGSPEPTPTPEVLRIRLGNQPTPTWQDLQEDLDQARLEWSEVYGRGVMWARGMLVHDPSFDYLDKKQWPWPVQTQEAKLWKEVMRIEGELLLMNSPTPDPAWTPTPEPTPTPTICEEYPSLCEPVRLRPTPTITATATFRPRATPWVFWPTTATPTPTPCRITTPSGACGTDAYP